MHADPHCGRPIATFEHQHRTAMQFLENPQKLWLSEHIDDKRAAIKLTFAERLIYERGRGYRTTLTTSPFRVISNFDVEKCGMVRVVGIEPTLLSEPDFESGASTSFTTPARWDRPNGKIRAQRPAENRVCSLQSCRRVGGAKLICASRHD